MTVSFFFFLSDIQPVEQLAFFGAMSTPPDIPAPNVSMTCKIQSRKCTGQLSIMGINVASRLQQLLFYFLFEKGFMGKNAVGHNLSMLNVPI